MNGDAHDRDEPTPEQVVRLRRLLLGHAREIALACVPLAPDEIVYACMNPDGTWGGLWAARVREGTGPYLDGQGLCFVFPARCTTARAVRALVQEHLGPAGAG